MKIIGIDSSGMVASVALATEEAMIAEYSVNYKKTHSQTLLPMLDELKKMTELDLHSVDAIAVSAGPGSFTGLRIGAATAKGLGLALGIPLIKIMTVDALAYNLYGASALVCPIMDARRGQVYSGIYEFIKKDSGDREFSYQMQTIMPSSALMMEDVISELNRIQREVIFLGDGVPVFQTQIAEQMQVKYSFAPANSSRQSAGSVAMLGCLAFAKGQVVSAQEFSPEYLRLSQAERERKEKAEG